MASRSFTEFTRASYGHTAQIARQSAIDFFAVGSGASVVAAGFHAIEHPILTSAFVAFALAFYGVSAISYADYRRFRRHAIKRRLDMNAG